LRLGIFNGKYSKQLVFILKVKPCKCHRFKICRLSGESKRHANDVSNMDILSTKKIKIFGVRFGIVNIQLVE
jgi:hypothetical protein